jgi:hypothetical protein
VQTAPGLADALDELAFDERMHVLVASRGVGGKESRIRASREDLLQPRRYGLRILLFQHTRPLERFRPRQTTADVVFEQTAIESKRCAELEQCGVGISLESA